MGMGTDLTTATDLRQREQMTTGNEFENLRNELSSAEKAWSDRRQSLLSGLEIREGSDLRY